MLPAHPVLWAQLTSAEVGALIAGGMRLAVLPVGATEQHGPHLPLGTDSFAAETIAHAASARTGVPVLPTLPVGCSLGHGRSWPGTLSLRPATLSALVYDIACWVRDSGCDRLLILNGHYTNFAPLRCALEEIRDRLDGFFIGIRSLWELSPLIWERYHDDGHNWHANEAETSLLLHQLPELVHVDRIIDEPDRTCGCVFNHRVSDETRSGVVGTPSAANATRGAELHALLVEALCDTLIRALHEQTPLARDHSKTP